MGLGKTGRMRDSWRRLLGLASRALLITTQRFLDVWSIAEAFLGPGGSSWAPWLLLAVLLATTALMAATMQRHWSALRRGRPHGSLVGTLAALLQVAPVWEMLDKVLFSQRRPRDRGRGPSCDLGGVGDAAREPLLQNESPQTRSPSSAPRSDLPKGSPGENVMRGVRKMSMVNLPQAMLSLWVHASELVPVGAAPSLSVSQLGLAFFAAFLCTAFGIADFVLYVWVHDAFVRQNKKLVTLHYCAEILCRVPAVVLFHVTYSRMNGYLPTLLLFAADVLLTSVLLLMSRLAQPSSVIDAARCCLVSCCTRQSVTQFLYSLVISAQLFVVNVVFFDPGFIFCYVNQAFYVIKYVELAVMLHFIRSCRGSDILDGLPRSALDAFCWAQIAAAGVSAALVWGYVPLRRRQKDVHLTSSPASGTTSSPEEGRVDPKPTPGSPSRSTTLGGTSRASGAGGHTLERLEEIFELLLLLGRASCRRNRAHILELIVNELWHQALRWDGEYDDGEGGALRLSALGSGSVSVVRLAGAGSESMPEHLTALLEGPFIVLQVQAPAGSTASGRALRRGRFDGCQVVWQDGQPSWTRQGGSEGTRSEAQEVLHLILPQLALALRWDAPLTSRGNLDAAEAESECGPLLRFLVQYALMTRQADFVSELYWALVCLSHEEESIGGRKKGRATQEVPQAKPYRAARLALLRALGSSVPGTPQGAADTEQEAFLQKARQLLRSQKELWRQKLQLLVHIGHLSASQCGSCGITPLGKVQFGSPSGSGAFAHRSEDLRNALRRWPELQRRFRSTSKPDEDELLLRGSEPPSRSAVVDLVNPTGPLASLPVDPLLTFRGVIPEECAVVPSNRAPTLFCCQMGPSIGEGDATNRRVREKYLLKVGDDLRQDQLILQIIDLMSCVWQDRLPRHDSRLLLQLAKFRVLAVTPRSGYVKFVPYAVPLTEALHQSQGNLVAWFERNKPDDIPMDTVLDNLCGSVAAACVVTYILGIGDRHLENLCVTRRGQFFHIDFSFVFGDDPKPCAPAARLPQQVAHALLATDRLQHCFSLAAKAYLALRPFAGLWGSILQLTAAAGGSGCAKLARNPMAAMAGLRERLRVDEADDELAASEFLCLVRESSEGLASILMDKVHAAGLFWR